MTLSINQSCHMEYITDLHFHSKYSRAVSRDMDLEHIAKWAKIKGLHVVTTADFTHPTWFRELKEKLILKDNGLYQLKDQKSDIFFTLTTEISCIYSKGGKTRRIHLVAVAPDLPAVDKINAQLNLIGNLKSDGRPILGLDAKELVKIVLKASPAAMVIPAHIWTPWFSLFGSESGFDSLEECFEEMTPHIYAIETGLSSDPAMNWRLSQLDRLAITSSSDAHSPANLGREATAFELEKLTYQNILKALKQQGRDKNKIAYTIEFFPEEGKYHWDGHRLCDLRLSPAQTKKYKGICPVCKKPLTIGVLNRVDKLADRPEGFKPANRPAYKSLVPLQEIIAETLGKGKNTKGVQAEYERLTKSGQSEFNILTTMPIDELTKITEPAIAEGVKRVREGKITVLAGYDGVYGTVKVFSDKEKKAIGQSKLF